MNPASLKWEIWYTKLCKHEGIEHRVHRYIGRYNSKKEVYNRVKMEKG
jgi:hypothetical protein